MQSRRKADFPRRRAPQRSEQPSHTASPRPKRSRNGTELPRHRIKPRRLRYELLEDRRVLDVHGLFASEAFPLGPQTDSLALGDLNGDGLTDIVTASSGYHRVSVLLGLGNGTFAPNGSYWFGSDWRPTSVALGDVSGDGVVDIIATNASATNPSAAGDASVLLGRGDGTFQTPIAHPVGANPVSVALNDLNSDGLLDVITANYSSGNISVLLARGDGAFHTQTTYDVGLNPGSLALDDLNGDGRPDAVIANRGSNNVSLLLGRQDGTFETHEVCAVGKDPRFVMLGDANGDGMLDVVTVNQSSRNVSVLLSQGEGTFASHATYGLNAIPQSASLRDLNGDQVPDLVVATSDNETLVLLAHENGTLGAPTAYTLNPGSAALALHDVNGDDLMDLVMVNSNSWESYVSLAFGRGDGTFQTQPTYGGGPKPEMVILQDINADGALDMVVRNWFGFSAILGQGDGTFRPPTTYSGPGYYSLCGLGDVDGDRIPDVVTSDSVLLGLGDGTFRTPITGLVGGGSCQALGDVNGDGKLDVVTYNSVLLGRGDGTFQTPIAHPFLSGAVVLADVNGDGKLDLAGTVSSDSVAVLLGRGDGTFHEPTAYRYNWLPRSIAVGDLNGDGMADLVITGYGVQTLQLSVLWGRRNGLLHSSKILGVERLPVTLGDLNGDGALDLVAAGNPIKVLLGSPYGFLSQTMYGIHASSVASIALGDLNDDGVLDLVTANSSEDNLSVLLGQSPQPLIRHSPSKIIAGPLDTVRLRFRSVMDIDSFDIAQDLVSFRGPDGQIAVTGHRWIDARTLDLMFSPLSRSGVYDLMLGPGILDQNGEALDLDRDGQPGEVPDDQYVARFSIKGPRVTGHSLSGAALHQNESVRFWFDCAMDTTTFSLIEDVASFVGPHGDVIAHAFAWLDDRTLEVYFDGATTGEYVLTLGGQIFDADGNGLDQDGDLILGETPDDQYVATFSINGPRVVGHTPSGTVWSSVDSVRLSFDQAMDTMSFALADDVVSFTGPQGAVTPTRFAWVDDRTLEVQFDGGAPGAYQLVLAPSVYDRYGNPLDQDQDGVLAEPVDDRYTATWTVSYSGTMGADSTWRAQQRAIVLNSSLTIPAGKTLTVEAGTVVKFAPGVQIRVDGTLRVRGTAAQPVVFTSLKDDTAGGDTNGDGGATSPAAGDWRGLVVGGSGRMEMDHFRLQYATDSINANATGAQVKLNSGVLRDGSGHGIYVWSPYAEVTAENCVIANHRYTGVFVRADSRHVFRNCTLVGNGFGGTGRNAAAIHLGGAALTLDNCILALNKNGLHHDSDPPQVTVRNSVFYNPVGQEVIWDTDPGRPDLTANGNLRADPLFSDRAAGNYELAAGSPAIDAGRGIQAPSTDILGRPRYDDRGMPNVGTGYPAFIDIGAYERQADTMSGDLAVLFVSPLTTVQLAAGESFSVQWTVANLGAVDVVGPWTDAVYLSRDPYISPDDILLERRAHDGTLNPGARYTQTLTAAAPATAGVYYVLVRANADKLPAEPAWANNVLAASGVLAVGLPTLNVGSSVSGNFAQGLWQYVALQATPGNTVQLTLDAAVQRGATALYVRFGAPPTLDAYDVMAAVANSPNQQLRILSPQQGIYYVGVYGTRLTGGSTTYTLSAARTELAIHQVTPNTVGNTGTVTIKIEGDNFHPDTQVQLVDADGLRIEATEHYQDAATLFATFDMSAPEVLPGAYDVVVSSPDGPVITRPGALIVAEAEQWGFEANVKLPSLTRPGRTAKVTVTYINRSSADIASPVLRLVGDADDFAWRLPGDTDWIEGRQVRFLAVGSGAVSTTLRPGQTETVTIEMRTPFRPGPYHVKLFSVGTPSDDGSAKPIDWDRFLIDVWPDDVDPDTWLPASQQLKTQLGPAWTDYVTALGDNFGRWKAAGVGVLNAGQLLQMEIDKALGRPTGIVAGRLVSTETGQTLAATGVRVRNSNSEQWLKTTTDAAGRFALYGLSSGPLDIVADQHLIESSEPLLFPRHGDLLDLDLAVIEAGHVAGQIADAVTEQAVPGVTVTIESTTGSFSQGTVSDQNGQYQFGELPTDVYDLRFVSRNHIPLMLHGILGTAGLDARIDAALSPGAIITGKVTDTIDDLPLQDLYVTAVGLVTGHTSYAKTDGAGTYRLSTLPPDTYVLTVQQTDFVPHEPIQLTVVEHTEYANIDIALERGGTLSGTANDLVSGSAVEGVHIRITPVGHGTQVFETVTGQDGTFSLSSLPAGEWRISAIHAQYAPQSVDMVISEGESRQLAFSLIPGASISGTVSNASGIGVPGVGVTVQTVDGGPTVAMALTAADGTYRITGLSANDYTLTIRASGIVAQQSGKISLRDSEHIDGRDFTIEQAVTVSGTVTNSNNTPIANARVLLTSSDRISLVTTTNEAGDWTIDQCGSGVYYAHISIADYIAHWQMISVHDGLPVELDIVLTAAGRIRGQVQDSDGNKTPEATVQLIDSLGLRHEQVTDTNGYYDFPQLKPGMYTVRLIHDSSLFQDAQLFLAEGQVVDYSLVSQTADLEIFVNDEEGIPTKNAGILLIENSLQRRDHVFLSTTSSALGFAEFSRLPHGRYTVYALDGSNRVGTSSLVIDNSGDQMLTLSTETGHVISGTVRHAETQEPLRETIILFASLIDPQIEWFTVTNDEGFFTSLPVLRGEYRVSAIHAGLAVDQQILNVDGDISHDIVLSDDGFPTHVVLVDATTTIPLTGATVTVLLDGVPVQSGKTDSNGMVSLGHLARGTYDLQIQFESNQTILVLEISGEEDAELVVAFGVNSAFVLSNGRQVLKMGGTWLEFEAFQEVAPSLLSATEIAPSAADSPSLFVTAAGEFSPDGLLGSVNEFLQQYFSLLADLNGLLENLHFLELALDALQDRVMNAITQTIAAVDSHLELIEGLFLGPAPTSMAFPLSLPSLEKEHDNLIADRYEIATWENAAEEFLAVPGKFSQAWEESRGRHETILQEIRVDLVLVTMGEFVGLLSNAVTVLSTLEAAVLVADAAGVSSAIALAHAAFEAGKNQVKGMLFPGFSTLTAWIVTTSGEYHTVLDHLDYFNSWIRIAEDATAKLNVMGSVLMDSVDDYNSSLLKYEKELADRESELVGSVDDVYYVPVPSDGTRFWVSYNALSNEYSDGTLPLADSPEVTVVWLSTPPGADARPDGSFEFEIEGEEDIHAWYVVQASANGRTIQSRDVAMLSIIVGDEDERDEEEEEDDGGGNNGTSKTPEDKFGPGGYDVPETEPGSEQRFIPGGQFMDYRIDFWNKPEAPVPTQDAIILDVLDPELFDLATLNLTRIGFLSWDVPLNGGQFIDTRIDCRPEMNIVVEVKAGLGMQIPGFANNEDIDENTLVWWFHTIDPDTGEWPEDPMAGFLPPFNPETGFELGWVEFTVMPREGLPSGAVLSNVAFVEFDFAGDIYNHPAPKVDPTVEPADPAPWVNTIDASIPADASRVQPLPAVTTETTFTVSWSGQDDENGSGIARYDVYYRVDDDDTLVDPDYTLWLAGTTGTSAVFDLAQAGRRYSFFSVATDNVGHREPWPEQADAQTFVSGNSWQNPVNRYDVDGRNGATPQDVLILINRINAHPGDPSLPAAPETPPPFYDVNGDGYCTAEDVLLVINYINRQTVGGSEGEAEAGTKDWTDGTFGDVHSTMDIRIHPGSDVLFGDVGRIAALDTPTVHRVSARSSSDYQRSVDDLFTDAGRWLPERAGTSSAVTRRLEGSGLPGLRSGSLAPLENALDSVLDDLMDSVSLVR